MKRLTLVLAASVLLLASIPAMADVPLDVDLFWMWNLPPDYQPTVPIQFTLMWDLYGLNQLPVWEPATNRLRIPNREDPRFYKEVWWEVKWGILEPDPAVQNMLSVEAPAGYEVSPATFFTSGGEGNRIWTWKWTISPQPETEWIVFDQAVFNQFITPTNIFELEVGTRCIPESTTVLLGILGLSTVVGLRRLRTR
jgi:hypothetical protein